MHQLIVLPEKKLVCVFHMNTDEDFIDPGYDAMEELLLSLNYLTNPIHLQAPLVIFIETAILTLFKTVFVLINERIGEPIP